MGQAKKRQFFFQLISSKNGAREEAKLFCLHRTRDFQAGKKNRCLQTKMERRNKKIIIKKIGASKKKWSSELFFIKNFNHGKIEAANPSPIKLICCSMIISKQTGYIKRCTVFAIIETKMLAYPCISYAFIRFEIIIQIFYICGRKIKRCQYLDIKSVIFIVLAGV